MTLVRPLTTAAATTTATLALAATVAAAAHVAPAHGAGPAPGGSTPAAVGATTADWTEGLGTVPRAAADVTDASAFADTSWQLAQPVPGRSAGGLPTRETPSTPGGLGTADSVSRLRAASPYGAFRGRWLWPLQPRPLVLRRFEAPATRYGRGHRGIDLAAKPGDAVRSVDAGVVTHAATLAGRGTITLLHASGLRSTYEPVQATVQVGDVIDRGSPIGVVEHVLGHCGVASCLHLGALRGDVYVDPLPLLMGRVILLPVPASW